MNTSIVIASSDRTSYQTGTDGPGQEEKKAPEQPERLPSQYRSKMKEPAY